MHVDTSFLHTFIFIGYRGTGKTTVARKLAERLKLPMFDSDSEIERRTGKTITEIFAQDGELAFRNMEELIIAEILTDSNPFVVATGGGAILRTSTRERLRRAGRVIWLTATPETVLHRIMNDAASQTMRPNLTSLPLQEEIVAVLKQRKPLYAETAHDIIDTDLQTADDIVNDIIVSESRSKTCGQHGQRN